MSLIAKDSGESSFTPVPPGMHLARCYRVVDLGTQKSEYQGQTKYLAKVMVQFEVHGEDEFGTPLVTSRGEPMSISKNYTLSLAEKATMRKDFQTWRGRDFTPEELRGFELKNVLGVWAMINVSKALGNNGKEYTNILGVNSVPVSVRKAGLPNGVNPAAIFVISNPDMTLFETFGSNLQEKIKSSPEWQARDGAPQKEPRSADLNDLDSDVPF